MSNPRLIKFACASCGEIQLIEYVGFTSKTQSCEICHNEKLILLDDGCTGVCY